MLLNEIDWHWVSVGALTFIVEILTGTGFLLWLGISAILVGLLFWVFPSMSISIQFIVFAALALLSALCWRIYLYYRPIKTDEPTLNRRAEQYIGRVVTLQAPIVNGKGVAHVDDTVWPVRCANDLPQGASVRIMGVEGTILVVEDKS